MHVLNDEAYMRLALQMAESALGQTGINPVVGCVLVKDGRIVGMGAHLKRGHGHAEVLALQMAGEEAKGSTAYVTLEPCSHYGKTPPCSDRLIEAGVARVVVAGTDPNPQVAGTGVAKLRAHGIDVSVGLLGEEASLMNETFNKYIVTRMPFVTLKTASTLDGRIASKTGDSKWITSPASREFVHTLRHRHQGIMVGVDTVIADDPRLSARGDVPAVQPVRIIADSRLRVPLGAQVLTEQDRQPTILLATAQAPAERRAALEARGITVLTCGDGPQVDLTLAMRQLGEREIGSILLEGGGKLSGAMLERRLLDKLVLMFAPKIIGGGQAAPMNITFEGFAKMDDAITLDRLKVEQFGPDVCLTGYPVFKS
ncbi:bifunctional diaminohydroxyphosphoribosylaminopyrimidine deaminase/5-amino-6-(5-phosphoribosylamino)uracil reductase RibD [Paenibacillus sp. CGMCC 1.16610]|uniref:Riboflavin biosynthesis protein RibD n=1 Tax=Paenibacillus anseongense TaxID=2682845 RepID=A0ABW9U7I8_9BACL|nr:MULTISPECIES: bifunctional diaminohydroxyphosphoribosylaminopyrimidine deaminase/5-amino-6-(5-phosphoribosylamino)uracil reductase RibD [Paenibacillus]MBA2942221.1 bifunctional diaminohydroxyphosphoribosylaminopyrimidine deaminase/5-amino-6-(5-phosphoribosylamino)uracil reductase RibD [Paenibacillus sp. CGMCC 1.16610]MVQ36054.1 bifunctional diaminohydroxyphosphoribosylaminopyrimidine deaminase/5-amino-6-(5-phosphoribosylamino)uracil reductase RibD [Paenibacillus anseongense]